MSEVVSCCSLSTSNSVVWLSFSYITLNSSVCVSNPYNQWNVIGTSLWYDVVTYKINLENETRKKNLEPYWDAVMRYCNLGSVHCNVWCIVYGVLWGGRLVIKIKTMNQNKRSKWNQTKRCVVCFLGSLCEMRVDLTMCGDSVIRCSVNKPCVPEWVCSHYTHKKTINIHSITILIHSFIHSFISPWYFIPFFF